MARAPVALSAVALAVVVAGCTTTTTRTSRMGPLASHDDLVTLVVTTDRSVVAERCDDASAERSALSCDIARVAVLPSGQEVRTVTIVRYTDALPSAMALEIDVHELCHAIASLQDIADPCHIGNGGILQASPSN